MLNQHHNLIIPLSDWLKIGDCVLDVPRREISAPQRSLPMRITVKTQQVLMVLVSHQGKVVSREAIIEWVWPDTLPTDDVLTQAITQLRKAFGDDRDAPRYLETIAKGGYRLLAPIHWLASEHSDAEVLEDYVTPRETQPPPHTDTPAVLPPQVQPAKRGNFTAVTLVALTAVAVGIGVLLARRPDNVAPVPAAPDNRAPVAAAPPDYQRITSLPGSEYWPSVSPDGSQVVYSAYAEDGETAPLMVQTTAPVTARQLTQPQAGRRDVMAAWSPDGRDLIFTRVGSEKECTILMMPSSGGEARTLGHCVRDQMSGYSWHPDGKHLIADGISTSQDSPGTIQIMDLTTGTWSPLRYEKGERDVDMLPMYSPDGKWIAFQRNISLSDLWRVPAAGGRPQRLTRLKTNIYGLAWTPDSKTIVFAGYRDGATYLMQLDIASGRVSDLGVADAAFPSIGWKAPSLAFVITTSSSLLYSMAVGDGAKTTAEKKPEPVLPSTGKDLLPAISPDGQQIAFVSDRSGRTGLWWAQLERPETLRWIEGLVPVARYAPIWSSDSERLLMVGMADGHTGIYEVTPATARVRKLPVPAEDPIHAEFLPDPTRMLVVADQGEGRLGVLLYDSSVTPWRVLASLDDVALARVDAARRRILFTRPARSGIWQAELDLKQPKLIAPKPGWGAGRRLAITSEGVWLAAADKTCALRWVPLPPLPDDPSPRCLHEEYLGESNFSYDDIHDRLYFSSQKDESSDIGWMRLASRTP